MTRRAARSPFGLTLGRSARVVTSDPDDLMRWGVPKDAILRC
ncbi:MAG: hypothetical protein ACRD0K_11645 [Egibacteraceae bacterium]